MFDCFSKPIHFACGAPRSVTSSGRVVWKRGSVLLLTASLFLAAPLSSASAFVSGGPSGIGAAVQSDATITKAAFLGRRFGRGGRGFRAGGYRRGGYGYRRGFRGRGYGGGYGVGVGAGLAGLAAGAVIGGALAASQAPVAVGGDSVAYCAQRFRSYNRSTGTYTGYDGDQHACP